MKPGFVVGALSSLVALAVMSQEPRGWKQPLLQPTFPPKVVGAGPAPVWRMPLVHPTLPPTLAGKGVVKQQHTLLVPQPGTNGLRMTVTNFTVVVPGMTNYLKGSTNVFVVPFDRGFMVGPGPSSDEEYLSHWQPDLMYPTYPPRLAPAQPLGLLQPH